MATEYMCPYYTSLKPPTAVAPGGKLHCECASIKFPDNDAKIEFIQACCGSSEGYKRCPLKIMLDNYYYNRKYKQKEEG